jgi:hypothetical protein
MLKRSRSSFPIRVTSLAGLALSPFATALAAGPTVTDLQAQVRELENALASLKGQLADIQQTRPQHESDLRQLNNRVSAVESAASTPVKELEERVARVERADATPRKSGNELFFRGGFSQLMEDRAFGSFTDTHGLLGLSPPNTEDNGWYVGAGFDFLLTRDVWGMMSGTSVFAELGLEFKHLGSRNTNTVVPLAECLLSPTSPGAVPCVTAARGDVDITMLTVSASPKIEFMEGSRFRPWIIPVGLDINVISPPSDSATVLDLGAQFAVGAEYDLLPGVKIGMDARYHYAANFTSSNNNLSAAQLNALNAAGLTIDSDQSNDFWTVGAYIGLGF